MRLADEQYSQDTVLWGSAHDCVAKELDETTQEKCQRTCRGFRRFQPGEAAPATVSVGF